MDADARTTISVPASPIRNSIARCWSIRKPAAGCRRSSRPPDLAVHGADGQELTRARRRRRLRRDAQRRGAIRQTQNFVTPLKAHGLDGDRDQRVGRQHRHPLAADAGPDRTGRAGPAIHRRPPTRCRWTRAFAIIAARSTSAGPSRWAAFPQVGFGGGYSRDSDYQAITANVRVAQNFNTDNTTVSLGAQHRIRFLLSLWRRSHAAYGDERAMEAAVVSATRPSWASCSA